MRVLSWNLFHGRAKPPAGRPLLHEFATTLAGWSWDVALLQEVPPWWPPLLARTCGAEWQATPTSRNALLPVRRAVARRRPDLIKSNGGGSNAILLRPGLVVTVHARARLRVCPERRVVHAVRVAVAPGAIARLEGFDGAWIGNVHGQKSTGDGAPGLVRPLGDLAVAVRRLDAWSASVRPAVPGPRDGDPRDTPDAGARPGAPVILGGDLNLPREAVGPALPAPWARLASSGPDHVTARGAVAVGDSCRPERGALSDHAALVVDLGPATRIGA